VINPDIVDVLAFKGILGIDANDGVILEWDEAARGRPLPSATELAAWRAEYIAQYKPRPTPLQRIAALEAEIAGLREVLLRKGLVSEAELEEVRAAETGPESGR
jgi:hypothetical protein